MINKEDENDYYFLRMLNNGDYPKGIVTEKDKKAYKAKVKCQIEERERKCIKSVEDNMDKEIARLSLMTSEELDRETEELLIKKNLVDAHKAKINGSPMTIHRLFRVLHLYNKPRK